MTTSASAGPGHAQLAGDRHETTTGPEQLTPDTEDDAHAAGLADRKDDPGDAAYVPL